MCPVYQSGNVTETSTQKGNRKNAASRLENKLNETRRDIGQLSMFIKGRLKNIDHSDNNFNDEESLKFWKSIWEAPASFAMKNTMLSSIKQNYECLKNQQNINVTRSTLDKVLRKSANFKAPGLNGIQNCILKNMPPF